MAYSNFLYIFQIIFDLQYGKVQNAIQRTLPYCKSKFILRPFSAISDHLLICDCNINFDDFTILFKDFNINLRIKESLLVSRNKPIVNKTVKSFPLELFE